MTMIKVNIFYVSGFLLLPWPETFGLLIWSFNGGKSCFPLIVIRIIHVTLNTHWNCYFSATVTILLVLWVTWRYIMHLTCLSVCASEIIYMFSIELHENLCMQIPFGDGLWCSVLWHSVCWFSRLCMYPKYHSRHLRRWQSCISL